MKKDLKLEINDYLPLREVVFLTLRQAILKGELEPGERLMEINIYQINLDRDRDGLAFISHDLVNAKQGSPDIDPQLYDKVFSGEVTAESLEDICRIFNLEHPEG